MKSLSAPAGGRRRRTSLLAVASAALLAAATVAILPAPAATAASGIEITKVQIDKRPTYNAGKWRQPIDCNVEVSFTDSTPADEHGDDWYELLVDGVTAGYGSGGTATASCHYFTDGASPVLEVRQVTWDNAAGEQVTIETGAPYASWTYRELQHPSGAALRGPKAVKHDGGKIPTIVAGKKNTIKFTGEWEEGANPVALVAAVKGWTDGSAQQRGLKKVSVKHQAAKGTFTFKVPKKFAGRSIYITVKGTDGKKRSQVTDYMYTWEPMLVVKAKAKKTKPKWVKMSKKKMIDKTWLTATKAKPTKAGKKRGVKVVYQFWSGKRAQADPWSMHDNTPWGDFGGCPTLAQHVRVMAFKPGSKPVVKAFRKGPICTLVGARSMAESPAETGGALTAIGGVSSAD